MSEETTPKPIDPDQQPIMNEISALKTARQVVDQLIQQFRSMVPTRERSLVITKLQEGIMWMGMDLKRIRAETGVGTDPYPESYNPASPRIEPTADNLKM